MKDNKLIAEFMGVKTITIDRLKSILKQNREDGFISTPQAYTLDELKYDTSWDWLMPVISKITKDERCVENEYRERIMDVVPYGNIEDTIEAVVEFIKEYNLNN